MNHEIRSEQFDQVLDAYLAGDSSAAGEFQTFLELAGQLRELPNPDFKNRLKAEIERRSTMTATTARREGFRALTPFLMVRDADGLMDFLSRAFGAETTTRMGTPKGGMHGEMRIGNSMVMIGGGENLPEKSTMAIHMYVPDPDAVYQRAIAAGGKSLGAVEDRSYGERSGFIEDPYGNHWYIGAPLGGRPIPEDHVTANPYAHAKSARALMAFLGQAFGAKEVAVHEMGGRVMHAEVRIGDSILEMGEADGTSAFYVYVDDPDAAYRKALAAGATSLWEPADQPYGERNAGVADPWGNQWFPAKTIHP